MKTTTQQNTSVQITGLSHDGRGLAQIDGKTAFIHGALPGETVHCKIIKKHSRYFEAEATEILHPAPQRTTPLCPHFQLCGGCSLQHMDSEHQIAFKQTVLLEQLKHFGKVQPLEVTPPLTAHPWHYRRKARLGVRYVKKKQRVLVGFREKNSHFLADLQQCPVLHESVGMNLTELSQLIERLSQKEKIPQIETAISDQQTALIFRTLEPLNANDIEELQKFGKQNQLMIFLQPNFPETLQLIYPQELSKLTYLIPEFDLEMEFAPLDFIQVNGEINKLLIKQAIDWLDLHPNDEVLDLFCGLGNFTLPIARHAAKVIGIEGHHDMVQRAKKNAEQNQLFNTEFYVENLIKPNPQSPWLNQSYDKILLDPPRAGAKEIIPLLAPLNAKKIVYVSCNPATLARDSYELVYNYQYQFTRVSVVNMFPHTSHIEAIALFTKEF